jgi:hypothetical protein
MLIWRKAGLSNELSQEARRRKMWKKWISLVGLFMLAGGAFAQQAGSGDQPVKKVVYVVQTNDTLWDIAARFLNSPYYWPKIWERNAFVIDPDLIFPGDVLNLYPETEKLTPPPVENIPSIGDGGGTSDTTKVIRNDSGQVLKVLFQGTPSMGWIEPGEFKKAGKIIKTYDDRSFLGEHDHVWIDLGGSSGAKVGDVFSVFKVDEAIIHPVTKKKIGYRILNGGELTIVKLNESSAEAEISNSYREISNGDYIRPYVPPLSQEVPVVVSNKKAKGYIVANQRNTPSFAQGDVVYIDLGKSEGIVAGNILEVYIPGELLKEDKSKTTKQLPDDIIGYIVVIDPQEHSSVALVTDSVLEFQIGQKVRLAEIK